MSLQLLTILSPTTPCIPTLLLTALSRDRSRNDRSPFTGRFPFLASPLRCRLANASGRIEFIIVLFMDWSFASSCSPPRLSTSQLLSATDRPVLLSDWDFHPIVGAHFQAHISTSIRRPPPTRRQLEESLPRGVPTVAAAKSRPAGVTGLMRTSA